jgi:hypothetical protein
MNYDITFCSKKNCKNKECERNQCNIDKKDIYNVYFGDFENCENWMED